MMEGRKLGKKQNRKTIRAVHNWIRRGVQLFFFIAFPSVFTTAFAGVKYIFTTIGAKQSLQMTSFLSALIAILVYTIVFGRFFCGYACAFGSLGDFLHGCYLTILKKMKKKPLLKEHPKLDHALSYLKYVILLLIVLFCFFGIYGIFSGMSPWDAFSTIRALNPKWQGYIVGWIILLILLIPMTLKERFFCRFLCPMGAVFSLMPVLPFFSMHRDRPNCLNGCSACTKVCPSDIGMPKYGEVHVEGDCFQCGKCLDVCPKQHIRTGIKGLKGNEIWYVTVRVVILVALCVFVKI